MVQKIFRNPCITPKSLKSENGSSVHSHPTKDSVLQPAVDMRQFLLFVLALGSRLCPGLVHYMALDDCEVDVLFLTYPFKSFPKYALRFQAKKQGLVKVW